MAQQEGDFNLLDAEFMADLEDENEGYQEIALSQEEIQDILMTEMEDDGGKEMKKEKEDANQVIMDFVHDQRNDNTNKKTRQVMKRFSQWLAADQEIQEDVLTLSPEKLNTCIGLFLMTLKKRDGTDMEPDSVTSFHRAIDRFLRENRYLENIMTSEKFRSSRDVLAAKRKNLKAMGLGNKPNRAESLTDEMVEKLWQSGELGMTDPKSVQNTVFFFFTQGFGFRGSHESRQLVWSDIELLSDGEGREYLLFKEKLSKTRTGDRTSGCRAFAPKIFATGGNRCPIEIYKIYASHRPDSMLEPMSPFYLCPKNKVDLNEKVWYSVKPMGKNTIAKIIPNMAKNCQFPGKITNHSLRKNTCQNLIENGVPPVLICQLTGHKNVNSLSSYTTANLDQQRAMSNIITSASTNQKKKLQTSMHNLGESEERQSIELTPSSSKENHSVSIPADQAKASKGYSIERFLQASSGMLTGAKIQGNVSLNVSYNISSSQLNASPKLALNHN